MSGWGSGGDVHPFSWLFVPLCLHGVWASRVLAEELPLGENTSLAKGVCERGTLL